LYRHPATTYHASSPLGFTDGPRTCGTMKTFRIRSPHTQRSRRAVARTDTRP